ncbi:hypothetical protein BB561_000102 [Smittium simulii]|uniref:Endonuclease n=1 Tax=Smittium simulii TaxID=133385 RepID=A0A2T9Z0R0_9FUNG|nr:hypothetical protein BB561_000102 [Smittium simulii]
MFKGNGIFGAGLTLGGISTYFLLNKQNQTSDQSYNNLFNSNFDKLKNYFSITKTKQDDQQVDSQTESTKLATTGGSPISDPNIANGQEALRYGYPGPINDNGIRKSYAYSYNRIFKNPNWIAEHITKENLKGDSNRKNSDFVEDKSIPKLFRALLSDYMRSGYDRGHLAPAADSKNSQQGMDETFLLTNISPQVGAGFNRHYWAFFESFVRNLTKSYDDVYVITGPLYLPNQDPITKKWYVKYEMIGNPPNVAVPTHFYKIILCKNQNSTQFFKQGFVLPNQEISNNKPLQDFVVPVHYIEKASGLKFFDTINPKKTSVVELCKHTTCQIKINNNFLDNNKPLSLPPPK